MCSRLSADGSGLDPIILTVTVCDKVRAPKRDTGEYSTAKNLRPPDGVPSMQLRMINLELKFSQTILKDSNSWKRKKWVEDVPNFHSLGCSSFDSSPGEVDPLRLQTLDLMPSKRSKFGSRFQVNELRDGTNENAKLLQRLTEKALGEPLVEERKNKSDLLRPSLATRAHVQEARENSISGLDGLDGFPFSLLSQLVDASLKSLIWPSHFDKTHEIIVKHKDAPTSVPGLHEIAPVLFSPTYHEVK